MKKVTSKTKKIIIVLIIAVILGISLLLFGKGKDSIGYKWINDIFTSNECGKGCTMGKNGLCYCPVE